MKRRALLVTAFLAAGMLIALLAGTVARAESTRINQGDATAIFNAFGGGGFAVINHSPVLEAAPADVFGSNGAIRPFEPWNGVHVCSLDWHVIVFSFFAPGPRTELAAYFADTTLQFELDGAPLTTTRTSTRRFLRFDEEGYYFQQGRIMAPSDLSVGSHRLTVVVTEPGFPSDTLSIEFFVDPAGSGACV